MTRMQENRQTAGASMFRAPDSTQLN